MNTLEAIKDGLTSSPSKRKTSAMTQAMFDPRKSLKFDERVMGDHGVGDQFYEILSRQRGDLQLINPKLASPSISNIMPYQDPDSPEPYPPQEFEELEDGENPEEPIPDEEIELPEEDEILDDDPIEEIKEPQEKEFDPSQELPVEEEFPWTEPIKEDEDDDPTKSSPDTGNFFSLRIDNF